MKVEERPRWRAPEEPLIYDQPSVSEARKFLSFSL